MKRILLAAATALFLFGCALREVEYEPAYGYGGGALAYADCVYPDPCEYGYPYSDGFYPAPGSAILRNRVELSIRPLATRTVTRPSGEAGNRGSSGREARTGDRSASGSHGSGSSSAAHTTGVVTSSHSVSPASSAHR